MAYHTKLPKKVSQTQVTLFDASKKLPQMSILNGVPDNFSVTFRVTKLVTLPRVPKKVFTRNILNGIPGNFSGIFRVTFPVTLPKDSKKFPQRSILNGVPGSFSGIIRVTFPGTLPRVPKKLPKRSILNGSPDELFGHLSGKLSPEPSEGPEKVTQEEHFEWRTTQSYPKKFPKPRLPFSASRKSYPK